MFLIVVPLSGNLVGEREQGTLARLRTLLVSPLVVLLAKMLVFLSVCILHFGVMYVVGTTLLPLLDMPGLEMASSVWALWTVMLASALAAVGFGTMVGAIARTHDQAAAFGVTAVVIASAIGGIMVPVYLMPETMRKISAWICPRSVGVRCM